MGGMAYRHADSEKSLEGKMPIYEVSIVTSLSVRCGGNKG